MEGGLSGEPGVFAVRRAAVDHKHACALVPVLHLLVVGLNAQEIVLSPNHATPMDA